MTNFELPRIKYPEQKGLISIIVPIYNTKEDYLRECLDSILRQTFTNWEAILVNDGSTDDTGNVIDEYAKKDSRFVAIHKKNEGTLLARKTGLENSKGEFIANIDHDDIYYPHFLQKMYTKAIEINSDFVWCKNQITSYDLGNFCTTEYEWNIDASKNIAILLTVAQGPTLVLWDKLIRRKIYAKVCFPNVEIVVGEDPAQMLQIAYYSKSAGFVPEELYIHRLGGFSFVRQESIYHIQTAVIMNEILGIVFKGVIPQNVENVFYSRFGIYAAFCYFLLGEKTRLQFKNDMEAILPKAIKTEEKFNLKTCLFLASKGIEFPFRLREWVKNLRKKLW